MMIRSEETKNGGAKNTTPYILRSFAPLFLCSFLKGDL
jgi:hypothetical protein